MVRIAKEIDYKRLEELKEKLKDRQYLSSAIQQIAQTLTRELMNRRDG
jgi:hypothetical protein